ncbi:MAG: hypothetical protein HUJ64_08825 [Limosilactobacillus mucosae]|nr:hypothetical protein [Limosilactobacillus mucosae]
MSRKQPKRRILVKQLLQHGQVWFIRRYGYTAWKNVALNLNDRKDIRLGWALEDRSFDYFIKMQMLSEQLRVHNAMGDTIVAKATREQLRDTCYEYTKYRLNRYDYIEELLTKYDRRKLRGFK